MSQTLFPDRFASRMSRVAPSAIMELLKTIAGGSYIPFASGLPDASLFPTERLRQIADRALQEPAALQYGPAEGIPELRALVAGRLAVRGLHATAEQILITHGSQQALDLAARALLEPGSQVFLEAPSYLAAIQTFDSYESTYRSFPLDSQGMDVDALITALRAEAPRLLFLLPNFQNPTGLTLSLDRRQRIAEAAAERAIPLLEDDAYFDLRYEGEDLPPLAALADNPWALLTGTFSKTIAPGLRVGWIYGHPQVIARLGQLKQITDLHTSTFTQRVALEFCLSGELEPQIKRLRTAYRAKRDLLLAALERRLKGITEWTHPQGGMFLLLRLKSGQDASSLLPAAMERGVVFVPGASFFPEGGGSDTLRLNFASPRPDQIDHGIALLAQVVEATTHPA